MAERRMFAKTIIDSDVFLDMPLSTQALYFHLCMRADDDGFINAPKKIARMIGCGDDEFKVLIGKRFVIPFESGVVVIKHWKIHNFIQSDRYRPTMYVEEKAKLVMKPNKAYTECGDVQGDADPVCIQSVSTMDTQDSLGKTSLGKASLGKSRVSSPKGAAAPIRTPRGEFGWVKLTEDEYDRLLADLGNAELARCIRYVDESAQSNANKNKWKDWCLVVRRCHREKWGVSASGASGTGKRVGFQNYDLDDESSRFTPPDLLAEARELAQKGSGA
jgi:hypothetical protein